MNNKVIFIRYISVFIGVWLLLAGCKTGIDVNNLALPESILEDASASLVKSDQTGVNRAYAEVDPKAPVPDFTNADETDAGRVLDLVKDQRILVYIELPSAELKIDHVLRTLSAASIKLALNHAHQSLKVLNTKLMQERVANLGLNDVQAKAYALSVGKKINEKALEHEVIIVDVDELGVTPKEFFQVLTKPNIIAVSRKNIDKFEAFSGDILKQFTTSGLNPGHVFQVTKIHFRKWETNIDPAVMNDLVLKATKIISALEPNTSLGSLAKIYTLLDPIIDKDPTSSGLEADVVSSLAGYFQTSSKYVASIELDRRTLSDIYDKTKQNPLAFSEQERKLDKVFKMTAGIKGAVAPGIDEIKRSVLKASSSLSDLRTMDLPDMQRDLIDQGERNRDDIIKESTKTARSQTDRILADNKMRHEDTRRIARMSTQSIVEDARDQISRDTTEKIETMGSLYADHIKNAIKKIVAETKAQLKEAAKAMGQDTERIVKKAKVDINDTSEVIANQVMTTIASDLEATGTSIGAQIAKKLAETKGAIKKDTSATLEQTKQAIKKYVSDSTTQAQSELNDKAVELNEDVKNALNDSVTKALNKIIAQQISGLKGLSAGINDNTHAAVTKARQILADALVQAEEEIKKSIGDEHAVTRDEARKIVERGVTQTTGTVKVEAKDKAERLKGAISKHVSQVVGEATLDIKDQGQNNSDTLKDAVAESLKKAIDQLRAGQKDAVKGIGDGINNNTNAVVAKARQILADAIMQAEEEIKKSGQDNNNVMKDDLATSLKKAVDQMKASQRDAVRGLGDGINNNTNAVVTKARQILADAIMQAEDEIKKSGQDNSNVIKDDMATSLKKTLDQMKASQRDAVRGLGDGINNNTNAVVTKARQILADAIMQAEDEIKKSIGDEHGVTRDALKDALVKDLAKTKTAITSDTGSKLVQTEGRLKKHAEQQTSETKDAVTEQIDQKIAALGQNIDSRVKEAVARIVDAGAKQAQDVKTITQNMVVRQHRLTKDQMRQAQAAIVAIMQSETARVLSDIARMPRANRRQTAEVARKMVNVLSYYINGVKSLGANVREPIGSPAAAVTGPQFRTDLRSIEQSPRINGDEDVRDQLTALQTSITEVLNTESAEAEQDALTDIGNQLRLLMEAVDDN